MFKNMKLGTKIVSGFAVVLVITAAVGFVGFNGLSGLLAKVGIMEKDFECVSAVDDTAVKRREFLLHGFEKIDGEKTAYDKWLASYDEMTAELQELKSHEGMAEEDKPLVDASLKEAEAYREVFVNQVAEARRTQDEAFADWGRIGWDITESIGKANEEVIEPEFKKAVEAGDVEATARWATIRDGLNKDVVQPFLLLRVYAVYLAKTNSEAQWEAYNKALGDLQESSARWAELVEGVPRLAGSAKGIKASVKEYAKAGEKYRGGILAARSADKEIAVAATDLLDAIAALSAQIDHEMDSTSAQAKTMMVAFAAIGIVVGMVLAVVITRGITKPINRVIDGLMAGAEQVAAASGQVSSASQQMAEGASEQASSLEETSASLEEMTSMTTQNADNAKQASGLAGQVSGSADKSRDAMTRMSDAIQKIKGSSDETAKIIKTIDEIAFQTNLLALNAAVEAARAGEAGKGFAVVAEEVRNLAMRSAEAAKNTSELIEQSQSNAENGVSVSGEVEGILKEIVEGVGKVTHLIDEVSAASGEQAQGIEQVNTAVAQMDKVTQSNAANAEESASASEELSAQASELREVVNVLVGIVGGAGSIHEAGRAKPKPRSKTHVGAPKQSWQSSPSQGQSQATATAQTASAPSEGKVDPESVIPMSEGEFKDF